MTATRAIQFSPSDPLGFVIGFAVMAAYWPGISGLATTPRWDVGAALAVALFFSSPVRVALAHVVLAALIGWLALTCMWSPDAANGADQALKLVVAAVAFAWASTREDIASLIAGTAVGLALSSLVAVAQWFDLHPVPSYGLISGLFFNGDRLGEAAALVFAAALARRMWWAVIIVLPALVLAFSRVNFLAALAALALWIWIEGRGFERFVLAMMALYVVLGAAMTTPFWFTGGIGERETLYGYTISHLTFFGHGLGSFGTSSLTLGAGLSLTHPDHPHNEWLWLAYEGGTPAVALAAGFAASLWRAARGPLGVVLVAALVQSLLFMPWHDPASVVFTAVVAGHLVGRDARLRDQAQSGRDRVRQGVSAAPA